VNFGDALKGNILEFFVEDTGIGIPHEKHQDIFEHFHQVEFTSERQFGGSGLGLSISKAYIEMHGGKIWLKSEMGKGSVFYFTLPFKKTSNHHPAEIQNDSGENKEFKTPIVILIAEDEDFNFILLSEMLSNSNFSVLRAINGFDAVELCRSSKHIDLVLMDIKMPIMDGYKATKKIKKIRPSLPIIAQTAYSADIDKTRAFSSGCSDFVSKPFNKHELISIINRLLIKPHEYNNR